MAKSQGMDAGLNSQRRSNGQILLGPFYQRLLPRGLEYQAGARRSYVSKKYRCAAARAPAPGASIGGINKLSSQVPLKLDGAGGKPES